MHEVLRSLAAALSRRYGLNLNVVDLGAVSRQRVIHLHRPHQHLIVAGQTAFLHELAGSSVDNLVLAGAAARRRRRIIPTIYLSEQLYKFVRLLCL